MTSRPADPARRTAYGLGLRAERACALWLRLKGYRILAMRYRSPVGEVDIVARRGSILAFVEVKARRTLDAALESVTPRQRQRVVRAAEAFLSRHPALAVLSVRFDLIAVTRWRRPRHICGAWTADG